MAESQRVLVIEDDPSFREDITEVLGSDGHEIVAEVETLDELTNVLDCFGNINDDVDVVLVEGCLAAECSDSGRSVGDEIINTLRTKGFGGVIIDISGYVQIPGAFANPGKDEDAVLQILQTLGPKSRAVA
jgi:CheY-like chemotaxis protein